MNRTVACKTLSYLRQSFVIRKENEPRYLGCYGEVEKIDDTRLHLDDLLTSNP